MLRSPSQLNFDFEGNGFNFVGAGLSADQGFNSLVGIFFPGGEDVGCEVCSVGQAWNPSYTASNVYMGTGPATFNGTSYSNVAFYADLSFSANPIAFPSSASDYQLVQTPFNFTGALRAFDAGQLAFAVDLTGNGTAARGFDALTDENSAPLGTWLGGENRLAYLFADPAAAQTPEPASLLLLGTGIAGVFARRRSSRSTRQEGSDA